MKKVFLANKYPQTLTYRVTFPLGKTGDKSIR